MNTNKQIDWTAIEEKASNMTLGELYGALNDIRKTLPGADAMDREDGGTRGGYYRDEASVYRAEIARRGNVIG